ncbi:TPA: hypothetical protein I9Y37_001916 [Citrobacter freundii]|nr:hypothetical protein [Citrobacter freundii]HAT3963891.1 hypothetical protein [Citrobacter freundii]
MGFFLKLTKKEQAAFDAHLREIEKSRDKELTRSEMTLLIYKFKSEVLMPARIEQAHRRAAARELREQSHSGELSWSHTRPPRASTTR